MKKLILLASLSFFGLSLAPDCTIAADMKNRKVVVLFSGFSGSSGGSSGSEETGMQKLNSHLNNTFGNDSNNPFSSQVFGHSEQGAALDFIKSFNDVGELIVIGHSFGGDSAVELAETLKSNEIGIDLLVQVDSVGVSDDVLPDNVKQGINYWQDSTDLLEREGENKVKAADPTKTKVFNINAEKLLGQGAEDVTHTNIDELLKDTLTKNVKTTGIPEPLTIIGAGTVLAALPAFKREYAKRKKTKTQV